MLAFHRWTASALCAVIGEAEMFRHKHELPQPTVFVIDDDEAFRESVKGLLKSVGFQARTFGTTEEFTKAAMPDPPGCLILDIRLPGASGLDFQTKLKNNHSHLPIVFMTGYGDIPMSVKAMKQGAIEFLTKPFREQDLLDAIRLALERNREQRAKEHDLAGIGDAFASLTAREKQVFSLVTAGLMNKQIAGELNVSEITVKVHRGQAMRKMGARSLAQMVRMADALGVKKYEMPRHH
jgi:FixJ family two-component response regulator